MKIRILANLAVALALIVITSDFGGGALLNVVATLERQAVDWRLNRNIDETYKNKDIVIVDIDDDSLHAIGAWPWPRDKMAEITDQLINRYEAQIVAFTVPFSLADNEGLIVFDKIAEYTQGGRNLSSLRNQFDYDEVFASSIRDKQVVLGYVFEKSARVSGALPPPVDFYNAQNPSEKISPRTIEGYSQGWNAYRGYSGTLRKLLESSDGAGYVNFITDPDGFVRRMPLLVSHARRGYKSLALSLMQRIGAGRGQQQKILIEDDGDSIEELLVGQYEMKINTEGEMYLNFINGGGKWANFENSSQAVFRYVSAHRVLSGKAPKVFQDKIVLVGSSSKVLGDIYSTPINSEMPGVELLATQLVNITEGNILQRVSSTETLALAILIAVVASFALASVFVGPLISFGITVVLCVIAVYANLHLWDEKQQIINFTSPLLVLIGLYLWNSISGFIMQWRISNNLQSTFGQYVPPELAKNISNPQDINLDGESRELSVLFSDVRNFTSISETFTPKDLTQLMNRMLTTLSTVIHEHSGTVDKFIGDAVMAFWNAPIEDPHHVNNSVRAALAMQKAMKKLSTQLQSEGHPAMNLGIGICSGEANVGNMGSKLRLAYTAIGDTVNVASRVEGLTKYYKVEILVTNSTREKCDGIIFRLVDRVRVSGRKQALEIYEPIVEDQFLSQEQQEALTQYEQMRQAYEIGDFEQAQQLLAEYQKLAPQDGLAKWYEEKIATLLKTPPDVWEGITNFDTK